MNLVDDIYPVSSLSGRILNLIPDISDIFHAVIGGSVDFHYIHRGPGKDRLAGWTFIAGTAVHRTLTVDSSRIYLGNTGFSGASCSAEQIGMTDTLRRYLIFKSLNNRLLSFYIFKGNRTPFAV